MDRALSYKRVCLYLILIHKFKNNNNNDDTILISGYTSLTQFNVLYHKDVGGKGSYFCPFDDNSMPD